MGCLVNQTVVNISCFRFLAGLVVVQIHNSLHQLNACFSTLFRPGSPGLLLVKISLEGEGNVTETLWKNKNSAVEASVWAC